MFSVRREDESGEHAAQCCHLCGVFPPDGAADDPGAPRLLAPRLLPLLHHLDDRGHQAGRRHHCVAGAGQERHPLEAGLGQYSHLPLTGCVMAGAPSTGGWAGSV